MNFSAKFVKQFVLLLLFAQKYVNIFKYLKILKFEEMVYFTVCVSYIEKGI